MKGIRKRPGPSFFRPQPFNFRSQLGPFRSAPSPRPLLPVTALVDVSRSPPDLEASHCWGGPHVFPQSTPGPSLKLREVTGSAARECGDVTTPSASREQDLVDRWPSSHPSEGQWWEVFCLQLRGSSSGLDSTPCTGLFPAPLSPHFCFLRSFLIKSPTAASLSQGLFAGETHSKAASELQASPPPPGQPRSLLGRRGTPECHPWRALEHHFPGIYSERRSPAGLLHPIPSRPHPAAWP